MEKATTLAKPIIRAYAYGIDLLAIIFVQLILGSLTILAYKLTCAKLGLQPNADTRDYLSLFCGTFNFIAYFTATAGVFGNTLGKYMLRIQTVNEQGQQIGPKIAFIRTVSYLLRRRPPAAGTSSDLFSLGFERTRRLSTICCAVPTWFN